LDRPTEADRTGPDWTGGFGRRASRDAVGSTTELAFSTKRVNHVAPPPPMLRLSDHLGTPVPPRPGVFAGRGRRAVAPRGFSLVELLVVIGVVLLLVGILVPVASSVRQQAKETTEVAAARSVIAAWNQYAFDHRGRIMPGYRSGLPAFDAAGTPIAEQTLGIAAARYPWRIAPYLGHAMSELFMPEVNRRVRGLESSDYGEYLYRSSLYPRFGFNGTFIGGDEGIGGFNPAFATVFGPFYRTGLSQITRPEGVLVLASAASLDGGPGSGGDQIVPGYFRLRSPSFSAPQWAEEIDPGDPATSGQVSGRWSGRSVVGFAAGQVETRPLEALRDMRLWADQADRPDWILTPR